MCDLGNDQFHIDFFKNASVGPLYDKSMNLVKFTATDQDKNEQFHTINYKMEEENEFFTINSTGQVILKKPLGDQESFVFQVKAFDNPTNANDQKSTSTDLKIGITKDYPPIFNETSSFNIKEGQNFDTNPRSLKKAYDRNIDEGEDEKICYYLQDQTDLFMVSTESEIPKLTQLKELDREQSAVIDLVVIASNLCQETTPDLESVGEDSKLSVQINVLDINDVAPSFKNATTIFASISMVDYDDWTRQIEVEDPDVINDFSCSKSTVVPSEDGEGIADLGDNIFSVKQGSTEKQVTLKSTLVVTSNMKGHFTFNLKVNDGVHESSVPVKIVVINEENNRVVFNFVSSEDEVKAKKDEIRQVFNNAFESYGWIVNIDNIKQPNEQEDLTSVKAHFLSQEKPVDIGDIQGKYDEVRPDIKDGLLKLDLRLNPGVSFKT